MCVLFINLFSYTRSLLKFRYSCKFVNLNYYGNSFKNEDCSTTA